VSLNSLGGGLLPLGKSVKNVKSVKSGKNNCGRKSTIAEDLLKSLLEQGKRDAEIALAMGVSRRAIAAARQRFGLESNYGIDEEQLLALSVLDKTDKEIAGLIGVSRTTVVEARKRLGIETNYGLNVNELTGMHRIGKTDQEIAEELGVPRTTVVMARKRLGMKANKKKGRPAKEPKEIINKIIKDNIIRQLKMGYAPKDVAKKNGIKRKDVISIYMSCRPKVWCSMLNSLKQVKKDAFYMWHLRAEVTINKIETIMTNILIKGIMKEINELPPEEKGCLPAPEVMARVGVRNAYMVDMWLDAKYVGLKHMADLVQRAVERKYWQEIRSGIDAMDKDVLKVAEKYLEEEVYTPFFASEFSGIIAGPLKDTRKYNDLPGINLYKDDEYESDSVVNEILETEHSTNSTTRRFGKSGGKRIGMRYLKSIK
jgi:DNA-binding CsgD family transcriptional regulator